MTPQMIFAILALVQEAITLEPQVATALQSIFSKANPTPEDWAALRLQILGQNYHDYVPESALPATAPVTAQPPVVTLPPESNGPITQPGAAAVQEKPAESKNSDPQPVAAVPSQSLPASAVGPVHDPGA